MEQIQVLMSTYNGEKFLSDQIDSILNQVDVDVRLLIRDDGSQDGTVDILKEYARKHKNIFWYQGENIGPQKSFFDLLTNASLECRYFAFSDQDDYWLPEKLVRAVGMIRNLEKEKAEQPILYGSKVIYASDNLEKQEKFEYKNKKKPGFGNALVENIFMGCTEVFNYSLIELVRAHQPKQKMWHDWWLYLSATCFGAVIYDESAFVLYRQHGNNQVGMQNSWRERWKNRVKNFKKLKGSISKQAREFMEIYGNEYELFEQVRLIAESSKKINRFKLLISKQIYRQHGIDDLVYRFLFLLGIL